MLSTFIILYFAHILLLLGSQMAECGSFQDPFRSLHNPATETESEINQEIDIHSGHRNPVFRVIGLSERTSRNSFEFPSSAVGVLSGKNCESCIVRRCTATLIHPGNQIVTSTTCYGTTGGATATFLQTMEFCAGSFNGKCLGNVVGRWGNEISYDDDFRIAIIKLDRDFTNLAGYLGVDAHYPFNLPLQACFTGYNDSDLQVGACCTAFRTADNLNRHWVATDCNTLGTGDLGAPLILNLDNHLRLIGVYHTEATQGGIFDYESKNYNSITLTGTAWSLFEPYLKNATTESFCAADCPFYRALNGACDQECDVLSCLYDSDKCLTASSPKLGPATSAINEYEYPNVITLPSERIVVFRTQFPLLNTSTNNSCSDSQRVLFFRYRPPDAAEYIIRADPDDCISSAMNMVLYKFGVLSDCSTYGVMNVFLDDEAYDLEIGSAADLCSGSMTLLIQSISADSSSFLDPNQTLGIVVGVTLASLFLLTTLIHNVERCRNRETPKAAGAKTTEAVTEVEPNSIHVV